MERESFPGEFATSPMHGRIYDKKPFPIYLEAGRQYSWCTCGHSKSQVLAVYVMSCFHFNKISVCIYRFIIIKEREEL